jgi:two-component system OmpR family response regulator
MGLGSAVRILLVEDSARVASTVGAGLREHGHNVVVASGVREADKVFASQHFDVAVVDIGLPDGSGLDWCRSARGAGIQLPILLLTARNGLADRVAGLDAGADDYLGKPFAIDELVARVRALSRRGPRWTESVRVYGRVLVDRDKRALTVNDMRLALTPREFDIVALLAWSEGRIVARDHVLEAVWGDASERNAASLDVLVARIRRKLVERDVRDAIRTVRQVGYSWGLVRSKRA